MEKDYRLYKKSGAHPAISAGVPGVKFSVWAPSAKSVTLISGGQSWENRYEMKKNKDGIWNVFTGDLKTGDSYRYVIEGADGITRFKSDPYAFESELRPSNASIIFSPDSYEWQDKKYMNALGRKIKDRGVDSYITENPMSVYEVHLGSWKKDYGHDPEDGFLNYRTLADQLSEYVKYMGYTHVELIGVCEHPLDASWGYQVTGYYAPTKRYGNPSDFMYFVDKMHREGIGVILDWVPAHFPKDSFGLENFDGTALYEHDDPLLAEYPEWGTKAFAFYRPEVRNYLISNAIFWLKEYHIDGLRVDAVAAMLNVNFGRKEWRPNWHGGTEYYDGIAFLRELNDAIRENTQGFTIAEDSSIREKITFPPKDGGIGFTLKWNMGWMNETLKYIAKEPIYRGWHHDKITHPSEYAFFENFMLVLSHDEVVHLKHSMLNKFPGSTEDKLGGLKTLYTYQYTFPGKKLLFMGQEFGEDREWNENSEINWQLANDPYRRDIMDTIRSLNCIYKSNPCLFSDSRNPVTFEWVNKQDSIRNTVSYIRRNPWNYDGALLVICNFSATQYDNYTCGVPKAGSYIRLFSTYDHLPGSESVSGCGSDCGSDGNMPVSKAPCKRKISTKASQYGNLPEILSSESPCDGYDHLISYNLRPYESVILKIL